MKFLHPEFLYYMLPPLFILFGLLLTQKEAQLTFFSDEVIDKLRVCQNNLTIKARNALLFLVSFLLIIALSAPVLSDREVAVKAKSSDIIIALDISDSMLADDVYPNRLKLAKKKAIEFLEMASSERIGVIAFAKNSYLVSPLSFDHETVSFLLSQLSTESITEKGTNILAMLEAVDDSIKSDKKYIFLISDGGDKSDFTQEIEYAKEKNIVLFILGVGTQKGAPVKLSNGEFIKQNGNILISKLNEDVVSLATQSGGVYIENMNSNEDILAMLKEIEGESNHSELKRKSIHKFIPLFYYPLGLALLILLIATSSMSKREVVHVPSVFILFIALFYAPKTEAGVLDFIVLKKAKTAYENGNYQEAESLYKKYLSDRKNSDAYYNLGSSLYKQGKYKEAIVSYERATFNDDIFRAHKYANIGNSYVKQKSPEMLKEALKAYEKSLKYHEDKQTRENLETVKKALKEQEQKNRENKSRNKHSNNHKKESQLRDNEKSKKKKSADNTSSINFDKNNSKKKENMPQLQELKNQELTMSEAEAQKWLKQLNTQKHTYMYMLNRSNSKQEESNARPW